MLEIDTYEVATLQGVGTEYLVYAEAGSERHHLRVVSGPAADYLGYFASFRDAVLEAVGRIEREIRENASWTSSSAGSGPLDPEPEPEPAPELPPPPPAETLEVEEWPTFPVVSYVRGVRQEDDLPTGEWLRRSLEIEGKEGIDKR